MVRPSVLSINSRWVQANAHVDILTVRLGNSGLKVSKIILGCMSYGNPEWQDWVLGEEEGIKQIKYAYVLFVVYASARPETHYILTR